jgi:hypothetical protein
MPNKATAGTGAQALAQDTLAAAVSAVVSNPLAVQAGATVAAALAAAPSDVVTLVVQNPIIAQFEQFGRDEAVAFKAGILRLQNYVALLQDQPFPIWELARDAFQRGAIAEGYAEGGVKQLWHSRVLKPLKDTYSIEKPVSKSSSANKPKSAAAQAKADKREAHLKSIIALSDSALDKRIAKADDDDQTMIDLQKERMARKAKVAKAAAKATSEANKKMHDSINDLLKGMNLSELTKAHTALAAIIAKRK